MPRTSSAPPRTPPSLPPSPLEPLLIGAWLALIVVSWVAAHNHHAVLSALAPGAGDGSVAAAWRLGARLDHRLAQWLVIAEVVIAMLLVRIALLRALAGVALLLPFALLALVLGKFLFIVPEHARAALAAAASAPVLRKLAIALDLALVLLLFGVVAVMLRQIAPAVRARSAAASATTPRRSR